MNILLLFLLSFSFSTAFAAEEVPVKLIKIFSSKNEFVVQKSEHISEGDDLFIRTVEMSHPKKAKITTCKNKTCLAILEVGIFELRPDKLSSYQVSAEKSFGFSLAGNRYYLGYGGPLGAGARVGLRKISSKDFTYGGVIGKAQTTSGDVQLSATTLSLMALFKLMQTGDWSFNLVGELGYALAVLNFENEFDAAEVKENVYVLGGAIETMYNLGKLNLSIAFGLSKNGFQSSYVGTSGEFANPYGSLLLFTEFGLHYDF